MGRGREVHGAARVANEQQSFEFVQARDEARRVAPIALGPGRILVGTCGFSYKDWIGPFYPERIRPNEMLPYYAERFPAVEVDSTYYRIPPEATFASMAARTPPDFRFAIKLPGSVTHLPDDALSAVPGDARIFRERLEPLVASGRLAAVLMQFPNGFKPLARTEDYLAALREALPDLPLVAEFRNREWQRAATLELLAALDVAWCNVDEPQFETLLRPSSDVTGSLAYVRFHGRNYKTWWGSDAAARYEYLYPPEELEPWTERVGEMAAQTKETLVFFNNHRFGQAAVNAGMFADMLLGRLA